MILGKKERKVKVSQKYCKTEIVIVGQHCTLINALMVTRNLTGASSYKDETTIPQWILIISQQLSRRRGIKIILYLPNISNGYECRILVRVSPESAS